MLDGRLIRFSFIFIAEPCRVESSRPDSPGHRKSGKKWCSSHAEWQESNLEMNLIAACIFHSCCSASFFFLSLSLSIYLNILLQYKRGGEEEEDGWYPEKKRKGSFKKWIVLRASSSFSVITGNHDVNSKTWILPFVSSLPACRRVEYTTSQQTTTTVQLLW